MEDRYLRILIYLELRGIDIERDMSDFMHEMFVNQIDLPYDKKIAIESTPEEYIERIVKTMHGNCHLEISCKNKPTEENPNRLLVEGRITYLGLEYLNQYRLSQSTLNLNEHLKSNLKFQKRFTYITIAAIGLTTLYTIATYYKNDPKSLTGIHKSLQWQSQILDSMKQVQKEIDSSLRIMAKKTATKMTVDSGSKRSDTPTKRHG